MFQKAKNHKTHVLNDLNVVIYKRLKKHKEKPGNKSLGPESGFKRQHVKQ